MHKLLATRNKEQVFLYFFVGIFLLLIYLRLELRHNSTQWLELARAFLVGQMHFLTVPEILTDSVFFRGQYFWPFGPLPAVIFMPFVWLADAANIAFKQGWLQFAIAVAIFWQARRLAQKSKFSDPDSIWWAIAFCFASPLIWIISSPGWGYLPYVWAVFIALLSLREYMGRQRWAVIGLLMSLLLLTRPTASLMIIFFIMQIVQERKINWLGHLCRLLLPFMIGLSIFFIYNHARFGNVFEQGYTSQILTEPGLVQARSYGLFDPVHVPGNLYFSLMAGPEMIRRDDVSMVLDFPYIKANTWGMSLFVVSPYLLLLFLFSYSRRESRNLLLTCLIIYTIALLYYGIGRVQLGYRYALDFFPLIYLLLLRNYPIRFSIPMSRPIKVLIGIAAIWDIYFVYTMFV